MPRYLEDYYREKARQLQLDIEHLTHQIEREDDPRELAYLRRLKIQMQGRCKAYTLMLDN